MNKTEQRLDDFLGSLKQEECEQRAGEMLLDFYREMGADGGNIWFAQGRSDQVVINGATTYSDAYIEWLYDCVGQQKLSVAQRVQEQLTPLRAGWDVDKHLYEDDSLDYVDAQVCLGEIGARNILITPIPTPGRLGSSGTSFYSDLEADKFARLLDDHGLAMRVAGYAAHIHIQSLRARPSGEITLSCRERECLLWLSRGMRTKEIADKLGLREVSINLYVANARRKLAANTREQAVAKAILWGLIDPA